MSSRAAALVPCIALVATPAFSGALDRTGQPVSPIFEPGGYVELSFGRAYPDVSVEQVVGVPTLQQGIVPPGAGSGDLAETFNTVAFAIKRDFTERLSGALIYDQPFGGDVAYPSDANYFLAGTTTTVDSNALTALVRYRAENGFSVHGGLRFQTLEGEVRIPFITSTDPAAPNFGQPYVNDAARDEGLGFVAGVAYERPEIALRVALTYSSEIEHRLRTVEDGPLPRISTTLVETPQSVLLDFQTGVAPDTLLFGSVRWADWNDFDIEPSAYVVLTGAPILFYPNDITTYTIGVGRRFTERLSGAVSFTYEDQSDDLVTNLNATSGVRAIGLGATYAFDQVEVTGAVQYGLIGDARTALPDGEGGFFQVSDARDNDVVGFALQVAYRF